MTFRTVWSVMHSLLLVILRFVPINTLSNHCLVFLFLELQSGSPFLSFPPLRSGTYPNIISSNVDLAAEVEREHKKIKDERARKQREREAEENENKKQTKDNEKKPVKDANQNLIVGKSEEPKTSVNTVAKKQGIASLLILFLLCCWIRKCFK